MAIANNPDRSIKDESDLSDFFDLHKNKLLSSHFDMLDLDRIMRFAGKFGLEKVIERYLEDTNPSAEGPHKL